MKIILNLIEHLVFLSYEDKAYETIIDLFQGIIGSLMMKRYVLDGRHELRHCQKRRDRDPPEPYPDTTVLLNLTQNSKILKALTNLHI